MSSSTKKQKKKTDEIYLGSTEFLILANVLYVYNVINRLQNEANIDVVVISNQILTELGSRLRLVI